MTPTPVLAVQEAGPAGAPTVVLLHGLMADGSAWRDLVADLAGDLRVVVVDLPGHGRSNRRAWGSLAGAAGDVADVVAAHAGGTACLVGHSVGGYVALELAASRPGVAPAALVTGVNVLPSPSPRLLRAEGRLTGPALAAGPAVRSPGAGAEGAAAARAVAPGTYARIASELLRYRLPAAAASSPARVLALAGPGAQVPLLRSLPHIAGAFGRGTARTLPGAGDVRALFAATVRAHTLGAGLPAELLDPDVPHRRVPLRREDDPA
ncbi:hypothetical protein NUM3379_35850 [Kineococcus sp. NUM-3379]